MSSVGRFRSYVREDWGYLQFLLLLEVSSGSAGAVLGLRGRFRSESSGSALLALRGLVRVRTG